MINKTKNQNPDSGVVRRMFRKDSGVAFGPPIIASSNRVGILFARSSSRAIRVSTPLLAILSGFACARTGFVPSLLAFHQLTKTMRSFDGCGFKNWTAGIVGGFGTGSGVPRRIFSYGVAFDPPDRMEAHCQRTVFFSLS